MSGEEKGALLLKSLAPEVVDKVLAQLGPERRGRLRQLMNKLQTGPETNALLEGLLDEINAEVQRKSKPAAASAGPAILSMPAPPAPPATTPAPAVPAPTRPAPAAAPSQPSPPPPEIPDPLAALAQLPPERIALSLADESSRTIAILLNSFDVALAGDVFKRLPAPLRAEVSIQFSALEMPPLEILQRISLAVVHKSRQITEKPRFPAGAERNRKMADMVRLLDKPDRLQVLEALQAKDAALADEIKNLLYRFDDVLRIENRSMQKVLMEIDTKTLALALRGVPEAIKEKFLSNLSKRAQDNLQEEMELMPFVPKDQVEEAQKSVVQVVQRLDLAGELVMTEE